MRVHMDEICGLMTTKHLDSTDQSPQNTLENLKNDPLQICLNFICELVSPVVL